MIIAYDTHDLGSKLSAHLGRLDTNRSATVHTFGLVGQKDISSAIRELRMLSSGCRTTKPAVHVWMSPSHHYSAAQWIDAWATFEEETKLTGQPYVEVRHSKIGAGGRTADHVHRVYLRLEIDGRAIAQSHSAPRAEKIARVCEFINGERLTIGRFNRAVEAALRNEGREDVADAILAHGLTLAQRPVATSKSERAQSERLSDLAADEIKRRAYLAFVSAENAEHFEKRLKDYGLILCRGDGGKAMILTALGAAYRLAAAVSSGAKTCKAKGSIKAADVHELAEQLNLPPIAAARSALQREFPLPKWQQITGADRSIPLHDFAPDQLQQIEELMAIESPSIIPESYDWPESIAINPEDSAPLPTVTLIQAPLPRAAAEAFKTFFDLLLTPIPAQKELPILIGLNLEPETARLNLSALEQGAAGRETPRLATPRLTYCITGQSRKNDYKAALADVSTNFGPLIRWVGNVDTFQKRIELHEGTLLLAADNNIETNNLTQAAAEIMISYALLQDWDEPRISGFLDQKEQEWFVRLCTQRGLLLKNDDLQSIIADELEAIDRSNVEVASFEVEFAEPERGPMQ